MIDYLLTHSPLFYLTQSLWRDEAFSILAAQKPLEFLITKLGFEPPVYYMLLHFWIKLFGQSEIATRSLSFLGIALATFLVIEWSAKQFKKHWLAIFTPAFFFFNPMLLYYAFEVRTYGWYVFFTIATLFAYMDQKWKWFIVAGILGFYTHTYFAFFLAALGFHYLWMHKNELFRRASAWLTNSGIRAFATIGIAALPWIIKIIHEAPKLKTSWYYPVDLHLVYSVLGNMFVGYEGTPWYGWEYTKYLSIGLLALLLVALKDRNERKRNELFVWVVVFQLVVCIGVSFIKPLFVNRYLISVSAALVLSCAAAIGAIRTSWIQKLLAVASFGLIIWVNWWFPLQHPKLPIRDTLTQINALAKPTDVYLAASPIIYLEVKYYAKDRSKVYLYNPKQGIFPWYIGDALVSPSDMVIDFPLYPARAFLIADDGSYEIVYRMPKVTKLAPVTQK
jgi:hypothetical protein